VTIDHRLAALAHLYRVYDQFCDSLDNLACCKFCADCCSRNVTMTTLEGLHLLQGLDAAQQAECLAALRQGADRGIFRPRWTTNQIAALCRDGHEAPDDDVLHDGSRCSLLSDAACSLYGLRPFGCRCMVSRQACATKGYADVDDWVLTVNTVFLQTIEHIDRPGCFGNMQDVLLSLDQDEWRAAYRDGRPPVEASRLIPNQPAPMLMVPPEHQMKMRAILAEIQQGLRFLS
jgi:Fe-S-cluster containining protein